MESIREHQSLRESNPMTQDDEGNSEKSANDVLLTNEKSVRWHDRTPARTARIPRLVVIVACAAIFMLLAVTVFYTVLGTRMLIEPQNKQGSLGLSCGSTVEEARARGCEFDLFTDSWVPAPCYDKATSDEMLHWLMQPERDYGAWPYFADRDGRERIPDVKTLSERIYPQKTYSTQEQHMAHCLFWMNHNERVVNGSVPWTSRGRQNPLHHALHCTQIILDGLADKNHTQKQLPHVVIQVGFTTC